MGEYACVVTIAGLQIVGCGNMRHGNMRRTRENIRLCPVNFVRITGRTGILFLAEVLYNQLVVLLKEWIS